MSPPVPGPKTVVLLFAGVAAGLWLPSRASHALTAAQQGPTIIDFEILDTTGPGTGGQVRVERQYANRGVEFNSPTALDYALGQALPDFAHSGTVGIEHCYAQEFCTTPFTFQFAQLQSRVRVWAGYRGTLGQPRLVVMRAFDPAGALVAADRALVPASQGPVPIQTPLEVAADAPRIDRVEVGFADDGLANGLALDDLEFQAQQAPPPPPPVDTVVVPELHDLTADEAATVLRQTGLRPGEIVEEPSQEHEPGRVVQQLIPAGTAVPPGTPVGFVLATAQAIGVPETGEPEAPTDRGWLWWVLGAAAALATGAGIRGWIRGGGSSGDREGKHEAAPPELDAHVDKPGAAPEAEPRDNPEVAVEIRFQPQLGTIDAAVEPNGAIGIEERRRNIP